MRSRKYTTLSHVVGWAAALAIQTSCGDGDEAGKVARGDAVVIDRTTAPLTIGEIQYLGGTYGPGCDNRAGQSWSIAVGAPVITVPPHPPLSVADGNVDCVLTLSEVLTTNGLWTTPMPIILGVGYADSIGAAFGPAPSGMPTEFFAKAKLGTTGFGSDFTINFAFSNDATFDPTQPAETLKPPGVSESSVAPQGIASPDYTFSTGTLAIITAGDDLVVDVTGAATLTAGRVVGQTYVLVDGAVGTTFAAVDAAYRAGLPAAIPTSIPGAAIEGLIDGDHLTTSASVVSLIIANIDVASGVPAYQVITLRFGRG